ncbi:MAG: hypothetical protein ACXW1W_12695 [Methylococcaceae bacterium]
MSKLLPTNRPVYAVKRNRLNLALALLRSCRVYLFFQQCRSDVRRPSPALLIEQEMEFMIDLMETLKT